MNKSRIVKVIGDFIQNGLNMDNYNIYQCNLFMKELSEFINCNTHFNAEYDGVKITIESVFFDPILSVELDKTTVQCIPITDEGWIDAIFEVIKFIHIREENRKEIERKRKKNQKDENKELDWV